MRVRSGWLVRSFVGLVLVPLGTGKVRAQATGAVQESTVLSTVYLKEGATIRGQILADNGPNGIRIRSQKSGATFVVPASKIDSIVRAPAPAPAAPVAAAAAVIPTSTPTPVPAVSTPPPGPAPAASWVQPAPASPPDSARTVAGPTTVVPPAAVPPAAPTSVPTPAAHRPSALDPAPSPPAAPDTAAQVTAVTFISGTDVYVGAGRLDGLIEGATVEVVQHDAVVATLRVKFLASHRAACEVVKGTVDIALGDEVRFHRQTAANNETLLASSAPKANRPRRLSGPGLHGRFGSRYLRASTSTVAAGQEIGSNGFNQPSFDARINGLDLGGTPLGLALDLRTRQTTTTSSGGTQVDGHTRVYQAALFWHAPSAPFRVAAGRQYLTAVGSIGLFDGALLELNGDHLTLGAFAGFEPDIAALGFSTAVHDYGLYIGMHNRPGTATVTSATIGAVGSYEGGQARREWGIAQASINNRYLSLYLLQEIDYYAPWKLVGPNAEKHSISWTSQFANVSVRPSRTFAINATYDKRRSVPTLRDFSNPETRFDDTYRQGYGAGLQVTGQRVYAGVDWRRSTGGVAGGATSVTSTLGMNRLTQYNLGLSIRATWYRNDVANPDTTLSPLETSGQLYSGRLSVDPVGPIHVDLNAGLRQEDNPLLPTRQQSTWYGVDLDLNLARAWFASFSGLRQQDPGNPGTSTLTQIYGGLTWRF